MTTLTGPRQLAPNPPEEIVPPLAGGRFLEGDDPDALRVEASERVPYGPVLTAGVHSLKHDQHRALALGEEALLERTDVLLVS